MLGRGRNTRAHLLRRIHASCSAKSSAWPIRSERTRYALLYCGRLDLLLWIVRVCAFARSLAHAPWLNRTELLPRVHDALPAVWLGQNRRLRWRVNRCAQAWLSRAGGRRRRTLSLEPALGIGRVLPIHHVNSRRAQWDDKSDVKWVGVVGTVKEVQFVHKERGSLRLPRPFNVSQLERTARLRNRKVRSESARRDGRGVITRWECTQKRPMQRNES